MFSFKFVFIVSAVFLAAQCEGAGILKNNDNIDFNVFVKNGAIVSSTLFKFLNEALDAVKPNVDAILNEMTPDAKKVVREMIDDARAKINEEQNRFSYVFTAISKALENLKSIDSCSNKISPDFSKIIRTFEVDAIKGMQQIMKEHKKDIENVKSGGEEILNKARKLFDSEIVEFVKCLTPGKKDSKECLNKEIDNVVKGVIEIGLQAIGLKGAADESFASIMEDVIETILPIGVGALDDMRTELNTLADCVSNLNKPAFYN